MSLQLAAKHLAAHGRGPDNTLVHMTPKEVESLQTLAMRHGGSLTINPQTGLPEAGFLSSILPLVAGAGLTAMGMPASMAALTVGGGTAMATGSLGKGLAAGLGAYGGSNLTASLIGAGVGAAPAAAAANAVPVETAASIAAAPPVPVETMPIDSPAALADPFKSYGTDPLKGFTPKELADAEFHNSQVRIRQAQLAGNPIGVEPSDIGSGGYFDSAKNAGVPSREPSLGAYKPMAQGVVSSTVTPEAISRAQLSELSNANNATPGGPVRGPSVAETKYPIQQSELSRYSNANNATPGGPMSGPSVAESKYPSRLESMTMGERFDALKAGATKENLWKYAKENPFETAGMLAGPLMGAYEDYKDANKAPETKGDSDRGAMANAGYQFDPGWANPTPRADPYGREQTYNRPRYYVPKKAADGGAVQHFDEGGMVARASQSPMLQQFIEDQAARAAQPAPAQIDVKQQFADYLKAQTAPTTGVVPDTPAPTTQMAALGTAGISALTPETLGGESRGLSMEQRDEMNDPNSWANQSPEQQASYYADHPMFGSIVQGAQKAWGWTTPGMIQNALDPGIGVRANLIAQGINPNTGTHALTSEQNAAAREAIANPVAAPGSETIGNMAAQYGAQGGGGGGGSRDAGPATGDRGYGSQGQHAAYGGLLDSRYANGGGITALAQGGMYNLGSYSDGGRLLRGPGDGVSDSIPAVIGRKQPARLADGEFVVPARIVSEIGNGSTEAGARKLYAMMDRVQKSRGKTIGKGKVAKNTRADKYLPA